MKIESLNIEEIDFKRGDRVRVVPGEYNLSEDGDIAGPRKHPLKFEVTAGNNVGIIEDLVTPTESQKEFIVWIKLDAFKDRKSECFGCWITVHNASQVEKI